MTVGGGGRRVLDTPYGIGYPEYGILTTMDASSRNQAGTKDEPAQRTRGVRNALWLRSGGESLLARVHVPGKGRGAPA